MNNRYSTVYVNNVYTIGSLSEKISDTINSYAECGADVICMFAEPLTRHIAPGGRFVCSGILKEKEQMVTDALLANGYELLKVLRKGSWVAMLSRRPLS